MSALKLWLASAAACVLASALAAAGGYAWGTHSARLQLQAERATAVAQSEQRARAAEALADGAVANYVQDHFAQQERHAQLQQLDRHLAPRVSLVVSPPELAAPACATSAPGAPAQPPVAAAPADPALSQRAVWVWNSALAGRDVPAGACSAAAAAAGADAAAGPCAEPAGVSLEQAWDNHAVNAASCAADRARYRQLIELLRSSAHTGEVRP